MPIIRRLRYINLFLCVQLVFYLSCNFVPGELIYRQSMISIPLILSVLSFWLINREQYKPHWLKLVVSAVLAELVYQLFCRGRIVALRPLNRTTLEFSGADEIMLIAATAIADVLAAFLGSALFLCALFLSGYKRTDGKMASKVWICAVVLTLYTAAASVCYGATIPHAAPIFGAYSTMYGYHYQAQAFILLQSSAVLGMLLSAMLSEPSKRTPI